MSEYLAIFLDEAEEQIETLDDGLLRLESEPDNADLLQEIFRAAHSLKSSSAAMGFAGMSALCHALENVLDHFRSGRMRAESSVIDVLLQAVDALKGMRDSARMGRDAPARPDLICSLESISPRGAEPDALQDEPELPGAPAGPGELVRIAVRLRPDCAMPGIRAHIVLTAIEAVARVVSCQPPRADLEAGRFPGEFAVYVDTHAGEEKLRQALDSVSEIDSVEVWLPGDGDGDFDLSPRAPRPAPDERVVDVGPSGRGRSPDEIAAMAGRGEQTVRVNVGRLDRLMNLVGELVTQRNRVAQIGAGLDAYHGAADLVQQLRETSQQMARVVGELQEEVMKTRMLPIAQLFRRFPRMVRDLAQRTGKDLDLVLEGEDTELDRSVIEEMVDPLGHLLRNAIDHGIETPDARAARGKPRKGKIILSARQEENHIIIEVTDDGAGIDVEALKASAVRKGVISSAAAADLTAEEALQLVFASGLSTSGQVSDISGRGVGMDVVKTNVGRLRGSVRLHTKVGVGTTVTMRLPLTLAISQALLVTAGPTTAAIPLVYVTETTRVPRADVESVRHRLVTSFRGRVLPLVSLHDLLGQSGAAFAEGADAVRVVVVRSADQELGLIVDLLLGDEEIVLKPLGSALGDVPGVSGATILGDGTVALVLDVASLLERGDVRAALREAT